MLGDEVRVGGCAGNKLIGANVIGSQHACAALGVREILGCLAESLPPPWRCHSGADKVRPGWRAP